MDFCSDIFQIYRQYCDIMSDAYASGVRGYVQDDESNKVIRSREALMQLLEAVEAKSCIRYSVLEEVHKLMSILDLTADFSEFTRFYDFVFFICRENGQKSITVSRAVMAWRLVLAGRFRLLNQWCDFVEENQRHNISEDTWRQVLAFSRCVHENLEGYDPEGAWPVLIDEFVEHMYRIRGSSGCDCGGSESQRRGEILTGLKSFPGSKRKSYDNMQIDQESPDGSVDSSISSNISNSKRRSIYSAEKSNNLGQNQVNTNKDECSDPVKHNSPISSPCAVEGCLSKGFAGLLSRTSRSQFDQERRVPYTK